MKGIDPSEEWRRFRETYSLMSEYELQIVANDACDLTEIASEALRAEISGRGLDIRVTNAPSSSHDASPYSEDLTFIRRVWDSAEARQAQAILLAGSVPSYLGPDNLVDVDDFTGSFEGGVDLKVKGHDLNSAHAAFYEFERSQPPPEPLETEMQETATQDDAEHDLRCPRCHCLDITFEGRDTEPAIDEGFHSKFNWTCEDCGHQWKDDGIVEKI